MNDKEFKDSIDKSGTSEASARAEKIKAIRNAIREEQTANEEYMGRYMKEPSRKPEMNAEDMYNVPKKVKKSGKKSKKRKKKKKTVGQKIRGLFPEKGDGGLEICRKIVFLCSIIAIIVCGYMVGDYYIDLWRSSMLNDSIKDMYGTYEPIYTTSEDDGKSPSEKYYTMLDGAKKLLDINPDVVGYMRIPSRDGDPVIELPVVQSEDNNKYLDKNFKGEESRAGALFLDWRNHFDNVVDHKLVDKNSDNLIVYGHNMLDESMFGSLRNYDWVDNYYEEHPIIQFNSNYEKYTYKIFAVFILDALDESETKFDCWNQINFNDEEEFYNFVNEAKKRTIRLNSVDVKYGDSLLTLSTCNKTLGDRGRLIVMARRLRSGEELYAGVSGSSRNKNIKWPTMYYNTKPNEKYNEDEIFIPYGPEEAVKKAEEQLAAESKKKEEENKKKDEQKEDQAKSASKTTESKKSKSEG